MPAGALLFSAPYDTRCSTSACFGWRDYVPFQALLGFDAHMAGFAATAARAGTQVFCLAAPEIFAGTLAPADPRFGAHATSAGAARLHLRFGTLRAPRLLKGAVTMGVVAEDPWPPDLCGGHPFAAGTNVPGGLELLLTYFRPRLAPRRPDGMAIAHATLPAALAHADIQDAPPGNCLAEALTLQTCAGFHAPGWLRSAAGPAEAAAPPAKPLVLLPWNLAHPGSLVPDLLRKVALLQLQKRFTQTVVVLPYNDVPGGIAALGEAARLCAVAGGEQPGIVFARGHTIAAGMQLVGVCERGLIDATDPEWRFTTTRLLRLGLPVVFVSAPPEGIAAPAIGPDETLLITAGPQAWRARAFSARRLVELSAAIAGGRDDALRGLPDVPGHDPATAARVLGMMFGVGLVGP